MSKSKKTSRLNSNLKLKIMAASLLLLLFMMAAFAVGKLYYQTGLANGFQIERARRDIESKFLAVSTTGCKESADPTKLADSTVAFYKYLRVNKYANRAVVRSCDIFDQLLMKDKTGAWIVTPVNINLSARANPAWQRECLIEDITVADNKVRTENNWIDEINLLDCRYMRTHGTVATVDEILKD